MKVLTTLTAVAVFALTLSTAQATPVEVNFTDTAGNFGAFFYDDSEAPNGSSAPFGQGGVSYDGDAFFVNESPVTPPPFYIEIYDNFGPVAGSANASNDIVYFTNGNGITFLQLACGNDCLSGSGLLQLTGLDLGDFTVNSSDADINNFYPSGYDGFAGGINLQSLTITQVPEPGTLALLAFSMVGVGVRRRKIH